MFLVQVPIYIGEILTHEQIEEGTAEDVSYGSGLSRERIAEAATVVAREAEEGDSVARNVMTMAAEELALAVVTVARRLKMKEPDLTVSYTGSVFKAGAAILEPFGEYIKREYSDAQIVSPRLPTVGGGVKIAAGELGLDFTSMLPRLKDALWR
jgi:N-acetylglucosamine kinase-like BadF-type ATPase